MWSPLNLKSLILLEKKARGKPITGGDVGWMVDCKGTLFLKKVHLGHYPPNIPSPWALWGDVYTHGKKLWLN